MKASTALFALVGVVFLYIGYVYLSHNAGDLPSFYPGHSVGSTVTHTKHGIFAIALGIGSFVIAWFQSGPKKDSAN
jgi:uncharacterized membrane protein